MHRLLTLASAALLLVLVLAPTVIIADDPAIRADDEKVNEDIGIALLSSDIGNGFEVDDIVEMVRAGGFGHVIIDWAWITAHWSRSNFEAIDELVQKLEEDEVRVAAMYRPRFFASEADDVGVPFQVDANGEAANGREICFGQADARAWGAAWAKQIVENCPSFDEVVVYNPRFYCECDHCQEGLAEDSDYRMNMTETFLREVRDGMREVNEDVKLGAVSNPALSWYERLEDVVDVWRPYLFVREGSDVERDAEGAREVQRHADDAGPALAKVLWGPDDRVTDKFLIDFIETVREAKVPFCFWTFSETFIRGKYDIRKLCEALDLNFDTFAPLLVRLGAEIEGVEDTGRTEEEIQEIHDAIFEAARDGSMDGWTRMSELARRGGIDAVDAFIEVMDSGEFTSTARYRAASCLATIGSPRAVEALIRHSDDASQPVRWYCARALGECAKGDTIAAARARLIEMLEDVTDFGGFTVAAEARDALAKIATRMAEAAATYVRDFPFEETIEDALERATEENRLVLAFVIPVERKRNEAGHEYAQSIRDLAPAGDTASDEEAWKADSGSIKEEGILTALLADPRTGALVRRRFVPVRLRMNVAHFWSSGSSNLPDPLRKLGTNHTDVRGPSLVFATPEGRCVHAVSHMGVFSAKLLHRTLRAVLARHEGFNHPDSEVLAAREAFEEDDSRDAHRRLVEALVDGGDFEDAETAIDDLPRSLSKWGKLAHAEIQYLTGDLEGALETLESAHRLDDDERLLRAALMARVLIAAGRDDEVLAAVDGVLTDDASGPIAASLAYFLGVVHIRRHDAERAQALFQRVFELDPTSPWTDRAKLRVKPLGPFIEEWACSRALGVDALIRSTTQAVEEPQAVAGAIDALLRLQRPDGYWVAASMHDARSSVVLLALRAVLETDVELSREQRERVEAAVATGMAAVQSFAQNPRADIWTITYVLALEVARYRELSGAAKQEAASNINAMIELLRTMERDGGYTYVPNWDPIRDHSFNTATVMLALIDAKEAGFDGLDDLIERGAAFLESLRVGDGAAFHYGTGPMTWMTAPDNTRSSSMRNPVCVLAMMRAGALGEHQAFLHDCLDTFFRYEADVRATCKINESFFDPIAAQDAYHYFYGIYYAACVITALDDEDRRRQDAEALRDIILKTREIDGSFVDGQISSGRCVATAFALLSLLELRKSLDDE